MDNISRFEREDCEFNSRRTVQNMPPWTNGCVDCLLNSHMQVRFLPGASRYRGRAMKKDRKKEMYGLCFRCEHRAEYLNDKLNAAENDFVTGPRYECSQTGSVHS